MAYDPEATTPPVGAAGAISFTFPTPVATWSVTHSLGRYPLIVLYDTGGSEFDADIECPDGRTVVVTHAVPMAGTVLIG